MGGHRGRFQPVPPPDPFQVRVVLRRKGRPRLPTPADGHVGHLFPRDGEGRYGRDFFQHLHAIFDLASAELPGAARGGLVCE